MFASTSYIHKKQMITGTMYDFVKYNINKTIKFKNIQNMYISMHLIIIVTRDKDKRKSLFTTNKKQRYKIGVLNICNIISGPIINRFNSSFLKI